MKNIWVIVADARRGRVFHTPTPRGELTEVEALVQPEAALPGKEFRNDAPGRTFDPSGQGRHAKEADTGHREQTKLEFAKHISQRLEEAYRQGKFDKLVLVSEAGFLGHLRRQLSNSVHAAISREIAKDLTLLSPDKLRAHLPDKLASAID